ncbi:hypothetical protein [Myxococcus landrumensis]|uniref:Lipoprotein n=1 Tax=Myxococcus landrumensis TaxID=2813577 RepID=A0ABX7N1L5_9BACT|nr:hypothetical protein [Myxococcus landrumus]QSQ11602.1 hypothetical protein JY572_24775 [Myxococcus landrumus]
MAGLLVLLAAPLAMADGPTCNTDCVLKMDDTLQRCMNKCPELTDPEQSGPYRSCARRCQEKVEKKVRECSEGCAKPATGKRPRKRRGEPAPIQEGS